MSFYSTILPIKIACFLIFIRLIKTLNGRISDQQTYQYFFYFIFMLLQHLQGISCGFWQWIRKWMKDSPSLFYISDSYSDTFRKMIKGIPLNSQLVLSFFTIHSLRCCCIIWQYWKSFRQIPIHFCSTDFGSTVIVIVIVAFSDTTGCASYIWKAFNCNLSIFSSLLFIFLPSKIGFPPFFSLCICLDYSMALGQQHTRRKLCKFLDSVFFFLLVSWFLQQ